MSARDSSEADFGRTVGFPSVAKSKAEMTTFRMTSSCERFFRCRKLIHAKNAPQIRKLQILEELVKKELF